MAENQSSLTVFNRLFKDSMIWKSVH